MDKYVNINDTILDRLISIGFTQLRFYPAVVLVELRQAGLWQDLQQTICLAAVEAMAMGYDPDRDYKPIANLVNRYIYNFLKSCGYRRMKKGGYVLREILYEREGKKGLLEKEIDEDRKYVIDAYIEE